MDTEFIPYAKQEIPATGDFSPALAFAPISLTLNVLSTATAPNGQEYRLTLRVLYDKPGAPSFTPQGFFSSERTPKGLQSYKEFLAAKESGNIVFTPYYRGSERLTYHVSSVQVPKELVYTVTAQQRVGSSWEYLTSTSVEFRTSDGFIRGYGQPRFHNNPHKAFGPIVKVGLGDSAAELHNPAFPALLASVGRTFTSTAIGLTTSQPPTPYYPVSIPEDSLSKQALITRVANRLRVQYDLGAELAEVRSTVESGKQILSQAIGALTRTKQTSMELATSVDSVWLQYRYGIQPIALSAKDLMEMVSDAQKGRVVKTERGRETQPLSVSTEPSGTGNCFYEVLEGERYFRVTGRAVFSSPYGNFTYGISFNPVTAAWEKTRYSFIVDWFSNFGEWLHAQTNYTPRNVVEKFTLSTKNTYTVTTYCRRKISGVVERVPVRVRTVSTYERQVIDPGDALPVFLNRFYTDTSWYKTLDAIALSLKPLNSALRKLH